MNVEVEVFFGTPSYVLSNTHIPPNICYLSIQNLRENEEMAAKIVNKGACNILHIEQTSCMLSSECQI